MPDGKPLPIWGEGGSKIIDWAWVDDDDWKTLRRYRWWLTDGYPARTIREGDGKTTMLLHREVMGVPNGDPIEVDHIDRDRLNARKSNLRRASRWQNEGNKPRPDDYSSRTVGVTRVGEKWKAQASLDGQYVYLGTFDTEPEAVEARARWEAVHRTEDRSEFLPDD